MVSLHFISHKGLGAVNVLNGSPSRTELMKVAFPVLSNMTSCVFVEGSLLAVSTKVSIAFSVL